MNPYWLPVAVAIALAAPVSAKDKMVPITVSIGAPTQGGFIETTQEVADSIHDVTNRLQGTDGITLVARPDQADVRIVITARGVGSELFGQRLLYQEYYRSAELTSVPISQSTWWVSGVLTVRTGNYRKEFTGAYTHPAGLAYYGGAWRECSKTLAKNLKAWIAANRDRLLAIAAAPIPIAGPTGAQPSDQRFCEVARRAVAEEPASQYWRDQVARLCPAKSD
jgi:hypothetical protein